MKIVTGYAGQAHITSNDDQGLLQGIFGSGNYILPVRGRFAATLISSNEMQIADGEGLLQGVHFRVEPETNDSVVIENGSQGMQRIDLVCARYQKDPGTGIETMSWIVKKGTPAASNPATPSVTPGDLLAGDTLAEFPIYSIRLNGITVQSVTLLATILSPQSLIGDTSIAAIGDGTLTGAISALNTSLGYISAWNYTSGSFSNLSQFTAFIDNIYTVRGSQGFHFGYIQAADSANIGLQNTGHYFMVFSNSANYRLVIAITTTGLRWDALYKSSGTWQSTWNTVITP